MSSGTINKVILVGNLGKDPEIRTMQNGKDMAIFSIATSENWIDKSSGIRSEKTEWHNIVVFSEGLVKIIKDFARKGNKVYIEGSLRTRKYIDQKSSERYITEIVLHNFNGVFTLLDSKNNSLSYHNNKSNDSNKQDKVEQKDLRRDFDHEIKEELIDDEIPF